MGFCLIPLPSGAAQVFLLSVQSPATQSNISSSAVNNASGATIVAKFLPIPSPTIFQNVGGAQTKILLTSALGPTSGNARILDCFIGQSASSPAWGFIANTTARVTFGGSNSIQVTNNSGFGVTQTNYLSDAINFSVSGVAVSVSFNIQGNGTATNTVLRLSGAQSNYITYSKAGVQEADNPVSGSYANVAKAEYLVNQIQVSPT